MTATRCAKSSRKATASESKPIPARWAIVSAPYVVPRADSAMVSMSIGRMLTSESRSSATGTADASAELSVSSPSGTISRSVRPVVRARARLEPGSRSAAASVDVVTRPSRERARNVICRRSVRVTWAQSTTGPTSISSTSSTARSVCRAPERPRATWER